MSRMLLAAARAIFWIYPDPFALLLAIGLAAWGCI